MDFVCTEDCYYMSNLFKRGELVHGEQFAKNKHFKPFNQEDGFEPDQELMSKSVQQLRSLYPNVEWKVNMRKPDFVKSIMEATNGK